MTIKDARREITRIMKMLTQLSRKVLIVTSIQDGKYTDWVLPEFKKRISLFSSFSGRVTAETYNHARRNVVSLTGRDLRIIPKR